MNRLTALAAVLFLWALIYLPALGTLELRGEEGRRIEPGVEMLESGDWLVPRLHGEPYLRKPPLTNWAVALSMKATGRKDEWAARLPSVLAILALGLVIVWTASQWMHPAWALTAAIFCITSLEIIDKGRMAEIEAIYVALTGIAFAYWISAWVRGRNGWDLWLVPMIFLGLGLLAKGPVNFLFFYLIVIPVIYYSRKEHRVIPHLGSLCVAIAIFCAWLIPYLNATRGLNATGEWTNQMSQRVGGGDFRLGSWLSNIPRAWSNGLPWILLAPLLWDETALQALDERRRTLIRATRWPLAIGFIGLMLIPGMLPRYTLPILPVGALMLAVVAPSVRPKWQTIWVWGNRLLAAVALAGGIASPFLSKPSILTAVAAAAITAIAIAVFRIRKSNIPGLTLGTALSIGAGIIVFGLLVAPRMHLHLRPMAETIDKLVPPNAELYAVDPSFESALFYVQHRYRVTDSPKKVPADAEYVFVRGDALKKLEERHPGSQRIAQMEGSSKNQFFLLKLTPQSEKTHLPMQGE